jgi:hypothetical protein
MGERNDALAISKQWEEFDYDQYKEMIVFKVVDMLIKLITIQYIHEFKNQLVPHKYAQTCQSEKHVLKVTLKCDKSLTLWGNYGYVIFIKI